MKPIAIAIHGAAGRMGRRLVALGSQDAELKIEQLKKKKDGVVFEKFETAAES